MDKNPNATSGKLLPNICSSNMAQKWEGFFLKSNLYIFLENFQVFKRIFPWKKKGWDEKEFQKRLQRKILPQ